MQLPLSRTDEAEIDRNEGDARVIYDLGRAMQTVGSTLTLFGALALVGALVSFTSYAHALTGTSSNVSGLVMSIVMLVFGLRTARSGRSFEQVATTTGKDTTHLMAALRDLKKMFGLVANVIRLAVCVLIAFLLLGASGIAWRALHH